MARNSVAATPRQVREAQAKMVRQDHCNMDRALPDSVANERASKTSKPAAVRGNKAPVKAVAQGKMTPNH